MNVIETDILSSILVGVLPSYMKSDDVYDAISRIEKRINEHIEKTKDSRKNKNIADKSKKSNKLDIEKEINSYTQNEKLREVLTDFFEMRKANKKEAKTIGTITRLFNKLDRLGSSNDDTKIAIVEKSVLNNWQDIWQLKEDVKESKKTSYTSIKPAHNLNSNELEKLILGKNDLDMF